MRNYKTLFAAAAFALPFMAMAQKQDTTYFASPKTDEAVKQVTFTPGNLPRSESVQAKMSAALTNIYKNPTRENNEAWLRLMWADLDNQIPTAPPTLPARPLKELVSSRQAADDPKNHSVGNVFQIPGASF
ncbi:MAG: hypothetical protein K9G62_08100 [Alphaproteobacteria bacterium]|nr:hypothetical protein [Alphaproteobacteria bacterium]